MQQLWSGAGLEIPCCI
ncbi:hypothetical protein LINPERPRIM_LOCUS33348 [Linum perenne]